MPEITTDYIRMPVTACKITATIDISKDQGIKALYCGETKEIGTYLFLKAKGWTMDKAKKWLADHKAASKSIIAYTGQMAVSVAAKTQEEIPIQRFKKDMIKVGTYTHPIHKWTMEVTEERLHRWVVAFQAMRKNGVDIEVPLDHSLAAEDNLGYLIDMYVEPDGSGVPTLYGIHEIRGDKAIEIVSRNKNISILVDPNFKDGTENSYGEAITHSSVVQQPVVPGQDEFIPIAASRLVGVGKNYELYIVGDSIMEKDLLQKIRKMLGAGDDLTEENALSRIEERINSLSTKNEELEKAKLALEAKLKTASQTASQAASALSIQQKDPDLVEQMASTAEEQLSLLVQAGKITPAVKDKLAGAMIGKTGERNVLALSIGKDKQPSMLSAIVTALRENDPAKLTEQTKAQVLNRTVPGSEDTEEVKPDAESATQMSKAAGVPAKKG